MSRGQNDKRKSMPKWNDIFEFWSGTSLPLIKTGFPQSFAENKCFACGVKYPVMVKLERAHIQPLWTGGSNACENLHLLCHVCHKDSENLGRPDRPKSLERYWAWFFLRDLQKRSISSRIRNGDPGFLDHLGHLGELEQIVKCWREIIIPVYGQNWELLDVFARNFGFKSWDDATDICERIVFV
jgi:hypothetical protein